MEKLTANVPPDLGVRSGINGVRGIPESVMGSGINGMRGMPECAMGGVSAPGMRVVDRDFVSYGGRGESINVRNPYQGMRSGRQQSYRESVDDFLGTVPGRNPTVGPVMFAPLGGGGFTDEERPVGMLPSEGASGSGTVPAQPQAPNLMTEAVLRLGELTAGLQQFTSALSGAPTVTPATGVSGPLMDPGFGDWDGQPESLAEWISTATYLKETNGMSDEMAIRVAKNRLAKQLKSSIKHAPAGDVSTWKKFSEWLKVSFYPTNWDLQVRARLMDGIEYKADLRRYNEEFLAALQQCEGVGKIDDMTAQSSYMKGLLKGNYQLYYSVMHDWEGGSLQDLMHKAWRRFFGAAHPYAVEKRVVAAQESGNLGPSGYYPQPVSSGWTPQAMESSPMELDAMRVQVTALQAQLSKLGTSDQQSSMHIRGVDVQPKSAFVRDPGVEDFTKSQRYNEPKDEQVNRQQQWERSRGQPWERDDQRRGRPERRPDYDQGRSGSGRRYSQEPRRSSSGGQRSNSQQRSGRSNSRGSTDGCYVCESFGI